MSAVTGRAGQNLAAPLAPSPRPARSGLLGRMSRGLPGLTCGIAGLLLAGVGEALVELRENPALKPVPPILSLIFYLAGIGLFVASARGAWLAFGTPPAARFRSRPTRRSLAIIVGGATVSLLLAAWSASIIQKDLKTTIGAYIWVASMLVLVAVALVSHRMHTWSPLWTPTAWPRGRREQWLAGGAIAVVMLAAVLARLLYLDSIPLGINADEGDRAAQAIQIVRGQKAAQGLFDYDWYRIHMLYFTLLAKWMQIFGVGFVQARSFGAVASIISVAVVVWMAARNFGLRVALLTGALLSVLGVSLQFARETTEAGPTAMLWALSLAFFLEGARTGRVWAWIGAGMAGALSNYFYPSGRLWAIFAAVFCVYAIVQGLHGRRWAIVGLVALAAIGALVAGAPFLVLSYNRPEMLTLRADETSIFTKDNPTRLPYYKREWSIVQLFAEQVIRCVGIFNQFADRGGVWPTERPILQSGLLAVLVLVGFAWVCLRWRDPRFVALGAFMWIGLSGMIVTVETPNLHRMSTAVPVIALLGVLVLVDMAARFEAVGIGAARLASTVRPTTLAAAALVGGMAWAEGSFYFGDYAKMDKWPFPTQEGRGVASQGTDALVITMGRGFHAVNAGWIRLLAPFTPRGGTESPGSEIPLALPAEHDISFMVLRNQPYYLPFLRQIYPTGRAIPWIHPQEGQMFTFWRVPKADFAASHGAMVRAPDGRAARVDTLGQAPPGWSTYPSPMRWTAGLRANRYWNYAIRIGPGPARLAVDGTEILTVPPGAPDGTATVALAWGNHAVAYDGTLTAAGTPARFEWSALPQPIARGPNEPPLPPTQPPEWATPKTEELFAAQTEPVGLYGVARVEGRPDHRRLDGAIGSCCIQHYFRSEDRPYTVTWRGRLLAPTTGTYQFGFFVEGAAELKIDGQSIFKAASSPEEQKKASTTLSTGPHDVEIVLDYRRPGGVVEWTWTPPGGEESLVPPTVLRPLTAELVGPPIPNDAWARMDREPPGPILSYTP